MDRRVIMIFLVIALTAVAAFWFFGRPVHDQTNIQQLTPIDAGGIVGEKLTPFTLTGLNGKKTDVVPVNGNITVLNFWATWCPPCREEMPELNKFREEHKDIINYYGINIQEPADKVAAFISQNKYTMPVYLDKDGNVARRFRISAIPTTLVIDQMGMIRFRKAGAVTASELESVIKGL